MAAATAAFNIKHLHHQFSEAEKSADLLILHRNLRAIGMYMDRGAAPPLLLLTELSAMPMMIA